MIKTEDMIGCEYGRLKVIKKAGSKNSDALWECRCSCGSTCYHTTKELKAGAVRSCGCLQKEKAAELLEKAREKRGLKNGSCLTAYNSKISAENTSGVKGVSYYRKSNKWRAQIRYAGKTYHLGLYEDIKDAAAERQKAEQFIKDNFDNPRKIIEYLKNI